MNKQEIYAYLKSNHVWHEITEHKAVCHMAELSQIVKPYRRTPKRQHSHIVVKNR